MTRNSETDAFCDTVVPVILSNNARAHALAARLLRRYGLSSVLCGGRRNILDLLDFNCSYLALCPRDGRLALEQLEDFADKWSELILVLIPVTDTDGAFLSENRRALESRYIISEDGRMDKLPMFRKEG